MANIAISNLHASGFQLFSDKESYLRELSETELTMTQGGSTPTCAILLSVATYIAYKALKPYFDE